MREYVRDPSNFDGGNEAVVEGEKVGEEQVMVPLLWAFLEEKDVILKVLILNLMSIVLIYSPCKPNQNQMVCLFIYFSFNIWFIDQLVYSFLSLGGISRRKACSFIWF